MSVFFSGVPTEPDIKKIMEKYPHTKMEPGQQIGYEEIGTLLGIDKKSSRFRTITNRWRKLMQSKFGIVIDTIPGEGFKVLTECEKVGLGSKKLVSAGNMAKKAYYVFSVTDVKQLDDQSRKEYDHSLKRTVATLQIQNLRPRAALPSM